MTAAFSRMEKMPKLHELLAGPQTSAEQAEAWRQAADVFGFRVHRRNSRRKRQTQIVGVRRVHG